VCALVPVLSHTDLVQTCRFYMLIIHFDTIFFSWSKLNRALFTVQKTCVNQLFMLSDIQDVTFPSRFWTCFLYTGSEWTARWADSDNTCKVFTRFGFHHCWRRRYRRGVSADKICGAKRPSVAWRQTADRWLPQWMLVILCSVLDMQVRT
jgi:hypothetical protein